MEGQDEQERTVGTIQVVAPVVVVLPVGDQAAVDGRARADTAPFRAVMVEPPGFSATEQPSYRSSQLHRSDPLVSRTGRSLT